MSSAILSIVLGVLTLIALAASTAAVLKANYAKSTIDTLERSNAALLQESGIQAAAITKLTAQVAALIEENVLLRSLASGADAVKEFAAKLTLSEAARQHEHGDIIDLVKAQMEVYVEHHQEMMEHVKLTSHTHGDKQ